MSKLEANGSAVSQSTNHISQTEQSGRRKTRVDTVLLDEHAPKENEFFLAG